MGERSVLWKSHPSIALALWVSIPSGDAEIAILRSALVDLVAVELPSFLVSPLLRVVSLRSFSDDSPLLFFSNLVAHKHKPKTCDSPPSSA